MWRFVRSVAVVRENAMTSAARFFFAGIATSFLLIGAGFGGGLMVVRTALEPDRPKVAASEPLPPARVILSAATSTPAPTIVSPVAPSLATQQQTEVIPATDDHMEKQSIEKEQHTERPVAEKRAEQRKAEARKRETHKRYMEKKARLEAARARQQQDQQNQDSAPAQQPERPGIMAFDDAPRSGSFFGN
jgi:type IV secretory pathway VirB10-like protein